MLSLTLTGYRDHRQPVVPSGDKAFHVSLTALEPVAAAKRTTGGAGSDADGDGTRGATPEAEGAAPASRPGQSTTYVDCREPSAAPRGVDETKRSQQAC
jgi:hypothetical protein